MKQKITLFKDKVLNLMFPKYIKCMFCGDELNQNAYNYTCENCLNSLPFIKNPCERCGSSMNENQVGVCLKCKRKNYSFSLAKSVFEYDGEAKSVIHRLKYNSRLYLAEYMVNYLVDVYSTWNVFPDIITCVPLFETKEKQRGFNQSKVIAEKFSEKVKVPFYDLCVKSVETDSQTSLNTNERMENIKDSFVFKKEYKRTIKNKTILIIDDVITTGATTSEVSKVLLEQGAKDCFVLTFAHTKLNELNFED